MTEVYKALMALGCEWLQLSSYRIKCKWRPNAARHAGYATMPSAGGATADAAFAASIETDGDVAMDDGKVNRRGAPYAVHGFMKVVAGDDGHSVTVPNLSTPDYSIKIGLTLYKVQQNIYLLDFQKKTGDAFCFMTLCANIITELKTLSAASKQQAAVMAQQQAAAAAGAQQQVMGGFPP